MLSKSSKNFILTTLCEQSQEGVFIGDKQFRFVWVNESLTMILGYKASDLLGKKFLLDDKELNKQQAYSDDYKITFRRVKKALTSVGFFSDDIGCMTHYGVRVDANLTIWSVNVDKKQYYVGLLKDIRSLVATKKTLFELMHYDRVTGLPNRASFINQLSDLLQHSADEMIVARFNVNRFRVVSHSFNESVSNQLLWQIAKRIDRLQLPALKLFANFGGDDFALLFVKPVYDAQFNDIQSDIDAVIEQFDLPFIVADDPVHIRIAMGISCSPEDGIGADTLLRHADRALNLAKHDPVSDVAWFKDSFDVNTVSEFKLKTQLHRALQTGEFVPVFQPKVDLSTQSLSGFELLVRWHHPTRGVLTPPHFMPAIIELELSFELFCNMMTAAAKKLMLWQNKGIDTPVMLCVNADASEFRHPNFLPFLDALLAQYEFDPRLIVIEMTESSLMVNDEQSVSILEGLKDRRFKIALDDFGTGYASLSYLHHYPFDFIKIDKSFVERSLTDQKHSNIVGAIVLLSHQLNMSVIAEGVEYKQQAQLLYQLGCEYAQGYYFGKPVDASAATAILQANQRFEF